MKVNFSQNGYHSAIQLIPENMNEAKKLLRMVKSVKKETPNMSVSFPEEGDIEANISFRNIKVSKQENYISLNSRVKK